MDRLAGGRLASRSRPGDWSYGESVKDVFGGYSKTGKRSVISLNSVLASRGKVVNADMKTSLSNVTLFRRDNTLAFIAVFFQLLI